LFEKFLMKLASFACFSWRYSYQIIHVGAWRGKRRIMPWGRRLQGFLPLFSAPSRPGSPSFSAHANRTGEQHGAELIDMDVGCRLSAFSRHCQFGKSRWN
jgi:hypothetical protein